MLIENTSPTPLMSAVPPASRSIPDPSMPGCLAGSASTTKSSAAGAWIRLDTETGVRLPSVIVASLPPQSRVQTIRAAGTHRGDSSPRQRDDKHVGDGRAGVVRVARPTDPL